MGYEPTKKKKPPKSVAKYVKEVINSLPKDGTWELNTTGKGLNCLRSGYLGKATSVPACKNNYTDDRRTYQ